MGSLEAMASRLILLAALPWLVLGACTDGGTDVRPPPVQWDAPAPRVVSAWVDESPYQYNLGSDVDRRGRFVAFVSSVRDGSGGVYLRDMRSKKIERLDVWHEGDQPRPGSPADEAHYRQGSGSPSISADGRFVAFSSSSPHLVPEDANGVSDVFLHDRSRGRLRLVSTNAGGVQGNRASLSPSLSADGRFVAFSSRATNLVSSYRSHRVEVYVKDLRSGRVRLVSRGRDPHRAGSASSPSISADGRRVAFTCDAVIEDLAFAPETLTVEAGDTVTWVWRDGSINHDVSGDDFASEVMSEGSFRNRFDDPGTYDYVCTLHPNMTGTIEVTS